MPPAPAAVRASTFAPEGLREHVLVEREIGDQAFQPGVFILELPDPPYFVHAEMPVALLPDVERGLTDAELATHIRHRRPRLGLAERVGNLLLRKLRPLHPDPSCSSGAGRTGRLL